MASDDRNPDQGTETNTDDASTVNSPEDQSAQTSTPEEDASERDTRTKGSGNAPEAPDKVASTAEPRRRGAGLLIIILLLMAGGLGAGGWWAWQQWTVQVTAWEEQQAELQDRLNSLGSEVGRLRDARGRESDTIQSLEQSQSALREDLSGLAARINREVRLQETDVQRLEIEYLLRTARHVSLLNRDIAQAERLLNQADQRLAEFDDLAYLPVREALAVDIQRLRELPRPDIDGLYFELSALLDRADAWQWWPDTANWEAEPMSQPDTSDAAPWYVSVWHELRGLITVRYRNDADAVTRLPPGVFNATRVRFQLALQQAQVALVQRNQALYSASLESARDLVQLVSDQAPQSAPILGQLTRLQDNSINPELPRIDRGLNALQALAESPEEDGADDNSGEDAE